MAASTRERVKDDCETFEIKIVDDNDYFWQRVDELCKKLSCPIDEFCDALVSIATNTGKHVLSVDSLPVIEQAISSEQELKRTDELQAEQKRITQQSRKTPIANSALENVLSLYGGGNSTRSAANIKAPPTTTKKVDNFPYTPTTFEPVSGAKSSESFNSRENGLSVQRGGWLGRSFAPAAGSNVGRRVTVERAFKTPHLTEPYQYMYTRPSEVADALSSNMTELADNVAREAQLDEFVNVRQPSCQKCVAFGMVSAADGGTQLTAAAACLQGDNRLSGGDVVPLDLSQLDNFSLFPGQVVVAEGANPSGRLFVVERLPPLRAPPLAPLRPDADLTSVRVLVAAAPFTTADSLNYRPLHDLLHYVASTRPHVLILTGPLVDAAHETVDKCLLEVTTRTLVERLLQRIATVAQSCGTQVVVVPSARDASLEPIYPTPPYRVDLSDAELQNVHLLSDPCLVSIGGVVFGLTATDVMLDLSRTEIFKASEDGEAGDRMGRLASHLLSQRCFYPVCPPADGVNVELPLLRHYARIHAAPHVLVLPSTLQHFVKDVDGTLCVNPQRLTRQKFGGTFAEIEIALGCRDPLSKSISDIARVQILRI